MSEKFKAGEAGKSIKSLMAGKIGYRETFEDVGAQLEALKDIQKKSLMLLVACDRIFGFFENRGGTANGPRLVKLVRDLAEELEISPAPSSRGGIPTRRSRKDGLPREYTRNDEVDVSKKEAKAYYDELVKMGAIEFVGELGARNVFCTIWECINEIVGKPD